MTGVASGPTKPPRAASPASRGPLAGLGGPFFALAAAFAPAAAWADASPWLAEPRTGFVSVSHVFQTADEFYRAERKVPTPAGGEDLSQSTVWVNLDYGLTDSLALDLQLGWAESDFVVLSPGPAPKDGYSGMVDTTVGVTWRVLDEAVRDTPSVALRVGAIVAGNYDTGFINSLGDGGSGLEVSLAVGRFFANRFALSGEVGYRKRDNDVPQSMLANAGLLWLLGERVTLGVDYRMENSESGLDIGDADFAPSRFPELDEDQHSLGLRLFWNLGRVGVNVFHRQVFDGRNTAVNDVTGATLSYFFDTL